MKIPTYNEVRKAAPASYRPAVEHGPRIGRIIQAAMKGRLAIIAIEAFDTLTQERVAALAWAMSDGDGDITEPFAILHNGDMTKRLVPCCGTDIEEKTGEKSDNGLTPEEWDLLPCYMAEEGN